MRLEVNTYIVLLRGINVGGKNKVPMAALRTCLEALGYARVATYIASGNVILDSDNHPDVIKARIEAALPEHFQLDDALIKVLVLSRDRLQAMVDNKPEGFGDEPATYHSDAIFLISIAAAEAMPLFNPREGVDKVWQGDGVVYSQRLTAQLTKSRLGKIILSPLYKSMTIRSWSTTLALLAMANNR
jgi:uncharacterized protein (DUF1697 family)